VQGKHGVEYINYNYWYSEKEGAIKLRARRLLRLSTVRHTV
jgi:hypothetical protein